MMRKRLLAIFVALLMFAMPLQVFADTELVPSGGCDNAYYGGTTACQYSPKLAYSLMGLASAASNKAKIESKLSALGCSNVVTKEYYEDVMDPAYGSDNCAYAMGNMASDSARMTLVFVVIRGSVGGITSGSSDWQSNFNFDLTSQGNHQGFEIAADKVRESLKTYVKTNGIKNPVYVITGHSRGAAVANLLAVSLINEGVKTSEIYAYTFASPDVTINENQVGNYPDIFNVCNTSDLITQLPRIAETVTDNRVNPTLFAGAKDIIDLASIIYPSLADISKVSSVKWFKYGTTLWFTEGEFGTDMHHPSKYLEYMKKKAELTGYKFEGAMPVVSTPVLPKPSIDEPITVDVNIGNLHDVTTSDYYYDAVKWAVLKGVTSGTSDNTFSPDASCTRAQAVTFLWRAAGSPEPASSVNPFRDVKASDYFYKAVLWANEKGITSGVSEGTFAPGLTCTRAQIVTFLYRASGTVTEPVSVATAFNDIPSDAYYAEAVSWALSKNITSGISENAFGPEGSCKRSQIVTFLYRNYK